MTTEIKRDLAADLAVCEAATPGPWRYSSRDDDDCGRFIDPNGDSVMDFGHSPDIDDQTASGGFPPSGDDSVFIEEAREGWPHAIRRAIAAETKLDAEERRRRTVEADADELAYDNERLREALINLLSALDRGDLISARMSSGVDYVIESAREALS